MSNTTMLAGKTTLTFAGESQVRCPEELYARYETLTCEQRLSWTDHHHFVRRLGSGGQGVVYLTERRGADQFTLPVALKVFSPERYEDAPAYDAAMEKIAYIAAKVAQIQQDNLLDVRNFIDRNRIRLMEMEWVDGYDLKLLLTKTTFLRVRERVSQRRWEYINNVVVTDGVSQPRLKPGIAIAILRDCLAALAALHREGIVHGDIKPSNIMLKRTGNAKIIDIGSAFEWEQAPPRQTCTPSYAAPEVLDAGQCLPQSDLCSLGYVLVEMLSGMPPFLGLRSLADLLEAKRTLVYRLPEMLPKDVVCNELLLNICRQLIAPDPMRRFPSAEAADLVKDGAAAFQRQLVKCDLASEYDNEIRLWLEELEQPHLAQVSARLNCLAQIRVAVDERSSPTASAVPQSHAPRLALPLLLALCVLKLAPTRAADPPVPFYPDKLKLLVWRDADGAEHAITRPADWPRRRAHILAGMQQAMGPLPDAARRVPLDPRVEEETDVDGLYVRRKISFMPEPGDRVPGWLLVPKGRADRLPAVLCLHQTIKIGKDEPVGLGAGDSNKRYADELARRGFVTLAVDYPNFGTYQFDAYAHGYASATMKGIWNHSRAVDLLASLPEVDPARIGVIGHSLGGHNSLFVAAFDERIRCAVSSCGFNSFRHYYGGDLTGWSHAGYMPRIKDVYGRDPARMPFDFSEVIAAIAPRAVLAVAPLRDANFAVEGVRECIAAARPVYELLGAGDHLKALYPDAEHDFPKSEREAAYAWLTRFLAARD